MFTLYTLSTIKQIDGLVTIFIVNLVRFCLLVLVVVVVMIIIIIITGSESRCRLIIICVIIPFPMFFPSQEYSLDCYFRQKWQDERLRFTGSANFLSLNIKMLDKIWKV